MRSTEEIMEKMDEALDGHTLGDCIDALVDVLVISILQVHDKVDDRLKLIEFITNHLIDCAKEEGPGSHAEDN